MPELSFENEEERLAHPQARKIPHDVWYSDYGMNEHMQDSLLPLLASTNEEEAIQCLADVTVVSLSNPLFFKHQLWICAVSALDSPTTPINNKTLERFARSVSLEDAKSFLYAAIMGKLEYMQEIYQKYPDIQSQMLEQRYYMAFRVACECGHKEIAEWLYDKANTSQKREMPNSMVFRNALVNNHHSIAFWLLSLSSDCLNHVERHQREFGDMINPYLRQELALLQQQAAQFMVENPNGIFNLSGDDAVKRGYILARHLIRTNQAADLDALRFLLNIPAIKALADQDVYEGRENALLRLAMSIPNEEAVRLLLNIQAVHDRAQANNFYRDEARGGLDVAQLARDRESSMVALTTGEQARLQAAITYYQPKLEEQGVPKMMDDLRVTLKQRYEKNPAKISVNGKETSLPFDFLAFEKLEFKGLAYEKALEAYYQHPDHSAWRYLAQPNPWMHEQAEYVNGSPSKQQGWSTYDEYQPLISMLYLAATDKKMPPTDPEMSVEDRFTLFIKELGLIGRAHNWDKPRIKMDAEGQPLKDKKGRVIREEYDDLQGDRPSCYSGVKRRLFQSVLNHSLIQILGRDDLSYELRDRLIEHFKSKITPENRTKLQAAFVDYIANPDPNSKSIETLRALDISEDEKQTLFNQLRDKFGEQFSADPEHVRYFNELLTIGAKDYCYALKLDAMTLLHDDLLYQAGDEKIKFTTEEPRAQQKEEKSSLEKLKSAVTDAIARWQNLPVVRTQAQMDKNQGNLSLFPPKETVSELQETCKNTQTLEELCEHLSKLLENKEKTLPNMFANQFLPRSILTALTTTNEPDENQELEADPKNKAIELLTDLAKGELKENASGPTKDDGKKYQI